MGNKTSVSTKVEHKIWPKGTSHELYTRLKNREKAVASRQVDEYFSMGLTNKINFFLQYGDDFELNDKGILLDVKRKKFKEVPICCISHVLEGSEGNVRFSCSNESKTYNNTTCDEVMMNSFKSLINNRSPKTLTPEQEIMKERVHVWIKAIVTRKGSIYREVLDLLTSEFMRDNEFTITLFEALRSQDDNEVVDNIIHSYPDHIKEKEFMCAYPSDYILEQELKTQTPRECWWGACSLSPSHKLLTENINKRNLCNITVCDININQLNMASQDIKIICKNKFENPVIDLTDTPISKDIENIFFIPSFRNTVLPFYLIFMACFMFNK